MREMQMKQNPSIMKCRVPICFLVMKRLKSLSTTYVAIIPFAVLPKISNRKLFPDYYCATMYHHKTNPNDSSSRMIQRQWVVKCWIAYTSHVAYIVHTTTVKIKPKEI